MNTAVLLILLGGGCGLKSLLPTGPVVPGRELSVYQQPAPSPVEYAAPPVVTFPILPLQVFGLQYAVDVVFVSQHPHWDMHEYARLDVDGESIWIAKDSDQQGTQTIVADRSNLAAWMPEIPAPRIEAPVNIQDRTTGRSVDVQLSYQNTLGEQVEVTAKGTMPTRPPRKRNGSTMGHSRNVVAAVLDIERFGSRLDGSMTFDGEPMDFRRILGLVPFRFLLKQTQAGVAVTNFRQSVTQAGFTLTRPSPATPEWPTSAVEAWKQKDNLVEYDNGINRFAYHFVNGGVGHINVHQHGIEQPTLELYFQPALPDMRRRFEGTVESRFIMHVNGEQGHGTGVVATMWTDEDSLLVRFTPTNPWGLADRPMESRIRFNQDGTVDVRTVRSP